MGRKEKGFFMSRLRMGGCGKVFVLMSVLGLLSNCTANRALHSDEFSFHPIQEGRTCQQQPTHWTLRISAFPFPCRPTAVLGERSRVERNS